MCDRPRRSSDRTSAGPLVWRWDCPERLVDQSRRNELSASRPDRNRTRGKTKTKKLGLFALRHKHSQTLAGAAGFKELRHRKLMTVVAALGERRNELGRALR